MDGKVVSSRLIRLNGPLSYSFALSEEIVTKEPFRTGLTSSKGCLWSMRYPQKSKSSSLEYLPTLNFFKLTSWPSSMKIPRWMN